MKILKEFSNGIKVTRRMVFFSHLVGGSISRQLTECYYLHYRFYIRENYNGIPNFNVSSNERIGFKTTGIGQKYQVLEICCPAKLKEKLALKISEIDELSRPITSNKNFSYKWVAQVLVEKQTIFLD
ncbi:MAG: hypothetical protein RIB01_15300 [Balneola sp.]